MASGSGGGCGRSVIGLLLLVPAPADVNSAVGLRRCRSWLVHGWTRLLRSMASLVAGRVGEHEAKK